jgi:hypothetical protein
VIARITGLPERTPRRVLNDVIATGLLASETPKGAVSLWFPVDALEILLPRLFPETSSTSSQDAIIGAAGVFLKCNAVAFAALTRRRLFSSPCGAGLNILTGPNDAEKTADY